MFKNLVHVVLRKSERRLGANRSTANFDAAGDVADMQLRAVLSLLPGGIEALVKSSYEVFLRLSAGVGVGPESVVGHTTGEVQFNMEKQERRKRKTRDITRSTYYCAISPPIHAPSEHDSCRWRRAP